MKIIFLSHPGFLASKSMPRYANWLYNGMKERGHEVELWTAEAKFYKLPVPGSIKKWLGYIDQYVVFYNQIKNRIKREDNNVLYVFTDHALGPWVPAVKERRHVIHCHDFLAQKSALGEIKQNVTSYTGILYQKFIRSGYKQGKNFISISKKTQSDLHSFLEKEPQLSKVVYNGLNQDYKPLDKEKCKKNISGVTGLDLNNGYLLHVGGNQWYKNRIGVIKIFNAYCILQPESLQPLLMIGAPPAASLLKEYENSPFKERIHFICDAPDDVVKQAYSGATAFLFPSIAEGFGWPIAEAMASGCLVLTTSEQPMSEVAGNAAILAAPYPEIESQQLEWAKQSAGQLIQVLADEHLVQDYLNNGIENAKRFEPNRILDEMEEIYKLIK